MEAFPGRLRPSLPIRLSRVVSLRRTNLGGGPGGGHRPRASWELVSYPRPDVPFVSSPPGTQTVHTIPGGRAGEALVRETTASVVLPAPPGTATLEGALAAGALDEDAAPSLGRGGEETMAAVPVLTPAFTDRA